jgi:hypothetical protein
MSRYKILGIYSFANTLKDVNINEPVFLKHEKYNIKSKNAIGVYVKNNKKIGYLPIENNKELFNHKYSFKISKIELNQDNSIVEISRSFLLINKLDNYEFDFLKNLKYEYQFIDPPKDLLNSITFLINNFKHKKINIKKLALTYIDDNYVNLVIETLTGIETFYTVTYQYFCNNIDIYNELFEFNLIDNLFYKDFFFHRPEKYFLINYKNILKLDKIDSKFVKINNLDPLVVKYNKIDIIYFTKLYLYCKIIDDYTLIIKYLNVFINENYYDLKILETTIDNINILNNFYETFEIKLGGFYYDHNLKIYSEIEFINDNSIIIISDSLNTKILHCCNLANKKNIIVFNPKNGEINKIEYN